MIEPWTAERSRSSYCTTAMDASEWVSECESGEEQGLARGWAAAVPDSNFR